MDGAAPGSDVLRHPSPAAVVVLWHGRGANEAHVLRRLATVLHGAGPTVLTPDWDASSQDCGASDLRASLDHGVALADARPSIPLVLVGWSLGGTAALSLALSPSRPHQVTAVVGLAASPAERSPLDGRMPLESVHQGFGTPALFLVHGLHDTVVPSATAEQFAGACLATGTPCSLTMVESDHAGVVGAEYDPTTRVCVPSDGPMATRGLEAAVEAVRAAVAR